MLGALVLRTSDLIDQRTASREMRPRALEYRWLTCNPSQTGETPHGMVQGWTKERKVLRTSGLT